MINYWLAKQEPTGLGGYNLSTLQKEKTTVWDGVHNNLALKHMRKMKKSDQIMYYHTGDERQAVGIMSVITNPYPNPEEDNDRFVVVNVKFKKKIPKTCFIRTDEKRNILQKLGDVKDCKVISNARAKKHLGQDYQNDPIKVMKIIV